MLYALIGIIIGILVRDIKFHSLKKVEKLKEYFEKEEHTEFFEPMSYKEKFKNAQSIDDLIEK